MVLENPLLWIVGGPLSVIWTFLTMGSLTLGEFIAQGVLGAVGTAFWTAAAGALGIAAQ